MSTALDRLDAVQRDALERLRRADGSVERDLLVQLVETSCLLELAKIDATRFDPAAYLQQCLDVVVELFPVTGAAVVVQVDWWPELALESGASVPAVDGARAALTIDGTHVGHLTIGPSVVALDVTGFAETAAAQISSGLAACVEVERQRRGASVANAMRLAADLDPQDPSRSLEAVVEQLAAFTGTEYAELIVDHPVVGAPLVARAGIDAAVGHLPSRVTSRELEVGLVVVKRAGPGVADDHSTDLMVSSVLEQLDLSLTRIERTMRLEREVETDPLTGLGNRRRLDRVLNAAMTRAGRYAERVTLIVLDLDGFKNVNDNLGHDVGDLVLRACARALQQASNGYDEIVRFGGDEIVVISQGSDSVEAAQMAERFRAAIPAAAATVLPPGLTISVSVGIATYPDSAVDAESLIRAGDAALLEAKRAGKDTVVVAPLVAHLAIDGGGPAPAAVEPAGDVAEPTRRRRSLFRRH